MIADLTIKETGFCDRLKLLTFYITVAQIRKDHSIYIKENRTPEGPFLFVDMCEIDGFKTLPWKENAGSDNLKIDYGFEPNIKPSIGFVKRNKPADITLSNRSFLNLWIKSYSSIRPNQDIKNKINSLNITSECLGIHIRMTDKVVADIKNAPTPRTMTVGQIAKINEIIREEIKNHVNRHKSPTIFLASDDQDCKKEWLAYLKGQNYDVITSEAKFNKDSFRQTSGEDFIIDLFSLARCSRIICTVHSGVPISSSYINGSSRYSIAFDRLLLGKWKNQFKWSMHHRYHFLQPYELFHSIYINYLFRFGTVRRLVRKSKRIFNIQ